MDHITGKTRTRQDAGASPSLKLRCPECFKLYSVNPLEIRESRPQFDCVTCKSRFWISYPECLEAQDGVIGFPVEWLDNNDAPQEPLVEEAPELQEKPFQCPKCTEPYAAKQNECFKCGVIFSKIHDAESPQPGASRDLKEIWENVVNNYDDEGLHKQFIQACWQEDALDYATGKYQGILEACADDERAKDSQQQIESLSEAQLEASIPTPHIERKKISIFRHIRISAVLIFICGLLIAAGYILPGFKNLMGLGVSALFFIIALRYYFRVR